MTTIAKAKETMTSRQRVLNTFAYEKADRVPVNYQSNPTIHGKLCAALGVTNPEDLLQILGVDFRGVGAAYTGPLLFKEIPGTTVNRLYGFYTRWVANEHGGYQDFCEFPLTGASDETIDAFKYPSPDDFDYDTAIRAMGRHKDKAIYCGHAGFADIINSLGQVMGMEDALVGLLTEDEAILRLVDRKLTLQLGMLERFLSKGQGRFDFVMLGEDLGSQHAPMISMDLYKSVLRPRHAKFIDLAKSYGAKVMVHTCGSSSWVYDEFIKMGVDAIDTLQPEATNMSPEYLAENFGGRLNFHGCISTAGPLAYGIAKEVTENCRHTLEIMMPAGGYHFAPTHQIQDNSPVENIIAMYQAVHDYGKY